MSRTKRTAARRRAAAVPMRPNPPEDYAERRELSPGWAAAWDVIAAVRRHVAASRRRLRDSEWTAELLPRLYNDVARAAADAARVLADALRARRRAPRPSDRDAAAHLDRADAPIERDLRAAWGEARELHGRAKAMATDESLAWRALKDRVGAGERRKRMARAEAVLDGALARLEHAREMVGTSSRSLTDDVENAALMLANVLRLLRGEEPARFSDPSDPAYEGLATVANALGNFITSDPQR